MVYSVLYLCRSDGMADVTDSKSVGSDTVWVRVHLRHHVGAKSALLRRLFFCLRQKRRHPHAPLLLLSNCDPLCWLAVGRPPCGRHSFPIGVSGVPPFLPGRGDRPLCSGVFFLPAAKKTPSARSLAPPFQTATPLCWLAVGRPPCGRHSFPIGGLRGSPVPSRPEGPSALLRRLFLPAAKRRHPHAPLLLLSNCDPLCWLAVGRPPCGRHSSPIGGLGGAPFFQAGGPSALLRRLFSACGKKDAIRTLPCSSFPTATRFAGSQLQAALRAAFFSNRRSRVSPFLPGWGPSALLRYFLSPAKNAIRTPGRQSSAAVSVYHIPFALSRQGRRCAHFHSP